MEPIKVTETTKIPDGLHTGAILSVEPRTYQKGTENITYVDLTIESESTNIKASYSAKISKESMLGQLLERFGTTLITDQELDPQKILTGQMCTFHTNTNEKGYSDILRETLKPTK